MGDEHGEEQDSVGSPPPFLLLLAWVLTQAGANGCPEFNGISSHCAETCSSLAMAPESYLELARENASFDSISKSLVEISGEPDRGKEREKKGGRGWKQSVTLFSA